MSPGGSPREHADSLKGRAMLERIVEKLIWGLLLGLPVVAVPEVLKGDSSGAVPGLVTLLVIEAGLVFLMHRRGMWPFQREKE